MAAYADAIPAGVVGPVAECCGQGHADNLMAKAYLKSKFTGFDFSDEGVAASRSEAESWGLTNARFEVKDVANLGIANRFDVITSFDGIHDQAPPDKVLRDIWEALKPCGTYSMLDEAGSSSSVGSIWDESVVGALTSQGIERADGDL